ncbi:rqcH [Symbiodinium natans]|uniref:RqcH protein n=1 Tax=Symbiodinium natans TaxID=878477 RepID=A0A812I6A9_9DINO|nr:rqcH [Symbiodinium natans]
MPFRAFRAGLCLALAPSWLRPWAGFSSVRRATNKRLQKPGTHVGPRAAPSTVAANAFKGFGEVPPKTSPKQKAAPAPKGCRSVLVSGQDDSQWQVLIGKSAADNDRLSLEHGRDDEVWMHAAHVPGSHVVIRAVSAQGRPPKDVISKAASLCAFYSKSKVETSVEVHVTTCGKVSKIPGAPPGQVMLLPGWASVKATPRSAEAVRDVKG